MYPLLRRLLFRLDAERAHELGVGALRMLGASPLAAPLRRHLAPADPRLRTRVLGLDLASPLGVAAGFDKGAGAAGGLFALGFGFVEVGTITPRPQAGNPRPRLFRLPASEALVNRMGFNNAGAEAARRRYAALRFRPGPLLVNVGRNRDTPAERAADDYLAALTVLRDVADGLVVNVSSPNTPGLRDLQETSRLRTLLATVLPAAAGKPLLVKIAPDLADADVLAIADLARELGVGGLILANTTVARAGLVPEAAVAETGGLSGRPLLPRTLELVRLVYRRHGPALPLVGVGGVFDADDAWALVGAGACLVQGYTGFVYRGPHYATAILRGLTARLASLGLAGIGDAVGRDA